MTTSTYGRANIVVACSEGRPRQLFTGWISPASPHLAIVELEYTIGVTHVQSGLGIARFLATKGAAEELIKQLWPVFDWGQDADAIRASESLTRDVFRVRSEVLQREARGEFGRVEQETLAAWNRFGRIVEVQRTPELGDKMRARLAGNRE